MIKIFEKNESNDVRRLTLEGQRIKPVVMFLECDDI